ncbi:MAG: hypothetical protein JRD04_10100 [Deltaproteobacteria bacterium]|nr:hypothetical protein [Deltaproteobacteria bacterium]
MNEIKNPNQTLHRAPGSLAVPAGSGGGAGELVVVKIMENSASFKKALK